MEDGGQCTYTEVYNAKEQVRKAVEALIEAQERNYRMRGLGEFTSFRHAKMDTKVFLEELT